MKSDQDQILKCEYRVFVVNTKCKIFKANNLHPFFFDKTFSDSKVTEESSSDANLFTEIGRKWGAENLVFYHAPYQERTHKY